MTPANEMELKFDSRSANEGFARVAVAAFMTQLNPTVEEVADVKTGAVAFAAGCKFTPCRLIDLTVCKDMTLIDR